MNGIDHSNSSCHSFLIQLVSATSGDFHTQLRKVVVVRPPPFHLSISIIILQVHFSYHTSSCIFSSVHPSIISNSHSDNSQVEVQLPHSFLQKDGKVTSHFSFTHLSLRVPSLIKASDLPWLLTPYSVCCTTMLLLAGHYSILSYHFERIFCGKPVAIGGMMIDALFLEAKVHYTSSMERPITVLNLNIRTYLNIHVCLSMQQIA